jgi:F0F1-type ATP synthase membrane subunit a
VAADDVMFPVFSCVSDVCFDCFFLLHMLQWLYTHVASVCFKCFIWMLQTYVSSVS